jgi:hypothetical protein
MKTGDIGDHFRFGGESSVTHNVERQVKVREIILGEHCLYYDPSAIPVNSS